MDILIPYVSYQDVTFIINISPEASLKNAISDKKTVTRDLEFLGLLNR